MPGSSVLNSVSSFSVNINQLPIYFSQDTAGFLVTETSVIGRSVVGSVQGKNGNGDS
jgi:hypothetical protein